QNSGTLCSYYPDPDMFISISDILCTYFSMNGLERGDFLVAGENSDINRLYFSQMDGYRWNNGIFFLYFNEFATSDDLSGTFLR
ncbi:hypothetical protein P9747_01720, partial [Paenibacillus macerans]|nr:hypothetical protein [Paenibacillus macerans]